MKSCLLLSGGMDSICIAWWKRPDIAITIDYGQLAAQAEIDASKVICKILNIEHYVLRLDCRTLGSGDMSGQVANKLAPKTDWWPYRNQLLATLAAMKAISLDVTHIWFGTVRSDAYHQDGRPEFFESISDLMHIQEGKLIVEAPAIEYSTTELIQLSGIPKEHIAYAHSCHTSIVACGMCRGCNKYINVYEELGYDLDGLRKS